PRGCCWLSADSSVTRGLYRKAHFQWRGGTAKIAHETMEAATEHADRFGEGLQAYRCPHCQKYHVGHVGYRLDRERQRSNLTRLRDELGPRVANHLSDENLGSQKRRLASIR